MGKKKTRRGKPQQSQQALRVGSNPRLQSQQQIKGKEPANPGAEGEQENVPPNTRSDSDDAVHFIGYNREEVQPNQSVQEVAKDTMARAMLDADWGQSGDQATYGNYQGRTILDEIYEGRNERKQLREEQKRLQEELASVKISENKHDAEIIALKQASEGFRKIRSRFIEVFERDITLQTTDKAARFPAIPPGNKAAHDGDVVTDAALYIDGLRDDAMFQEIYGTSPGTASSLYEKENVLAINLLNARATMRAKKILLELEDKDLAKWDDAFHRYIKELEASPDEQANTDAMSPLSMAYSKYWRIHSKILEKYKAFLQDTPSTTQPRQTSTQHSRNTSAAGSTDAP